MIKKRKISLGGTSLRSSSQNYLLSQPEVIELQGDSAYSEESIMGKSTFEQMGGTYRQEGDYLLPNLTTPERVPAGI